MFGTDLVARWRYIPGFERRRRARSDEEHRLGQRLRKLTGVVWTLCAATVVVYLIAALAGLIEPSKQVVFTLIALIAAALWLGHAVLVLYRSTPIGPDRERKD